VNVGIAIAVGKGIIKSSDSIYKDVELTKDCLLQKMGFVKRKASTSAKLSGIIQSKKKTSFVRCRWLWR